MRKIILGALFISALIVVPNVCANQEETDAEIITSQPDGVFDATVASEKRVFKNWNLNIWVRDESENHSFKVVKNSNKTIMSGSFSGTFHYTEDTVVPKTHISELKVIVDGKVVLKAKDFAVMKKIVGKDEVEKGTEKDVVKVGEWEFRQRNLLYGIVGAFVTVLAMIVTRVKVQREKENEILEGY